MPHRTRERLEALVAEDALTQGQRCTISALPDNCDKARLLAMLQARGLELDTEFTLIDSKFKPGTKVAFVTFSTEKMAFDAIMDAPFMKMSGQSPQIKPTQPKNNRSITRLEKEEQVAMQERGPTDGMTPSQLDSLKDVIRESNDSTLQVILAQFKIDEEGTFGNLLTEFMTEGFDAILEESKAMEERTMETLDDLAEHVEAAEEAEQKHLATSKKLDDLTSQHAMGMGQLLAEFKKLSTSLNANAEMEAIRALAMESMEERIITLQDSMLTEEEATPKPRNQSQNA